LPTTPSTAATCNPATCWARARCPAPPAEAGALLEITEGGKKPLSLSNGETRTFLLDGDAVVFTGWCEKPGAARIGFGECRATVLPATRPEPRPSLKNRPGAGFLLGICPRPARNAMTQLQPCLPLRTPPPLRSPLLANRARNLCWTSPRSDASPCLPPLPEPLQLRPIPCSTACSTRPRPAPEEEDSGLLPQLYASRLNPRSRDFYLAQFKRFDALDRSLPSWNMAAALLTLAWCSLHGLWREAAKYLAAVTAPR
jgi:hypothetical protein